MIADRITVPSTAALGLGAGAICALAGFTASSSPTTTLYAVAGLVLCVVAVESLLALLAVFIVLTFPETLPFGIASGTVAKPLGALLIGAWVLHLLRSRDDPVFQRRALPMMSLLVGFVGFAAMSALWATGSGAVVSDLSRLAQMAMLFVIAFSAARTRRDLAVLSGAYVFAAALTSSYALATGVKVAGRLTGGIVNSNFLAAELAAAILLAGFMLAATRSGLARTALAASIGINAVAFTLTQSRGGAIALFAGLGCAVLLGGRWRPHAIVGVLLAGAVGATYFFALAAPSVRDRLTNISAQGSSGRADEWQIAYRIFVQHPIGGAGLGNYALLAPHYATANLQLLRVQFVIRGFVAHNTYLQVVSELGLIGLVLFAWLILYVLAGALRALRRGLLAADPRNSALARGVIVAVPTLLVAYFFGSALYEKQLWLLLGFAAALPFIADSETPADVEE